MLSRVKRFAAPLILIVPAPTWMPAVAAAGMASINVTERDHADA